MKTTVKFAVIVALACLVAAKYEKVHMSQVTGLTFYRDKYTTARRTSVMPQLQCVKGDACRDFTPAVVQCLRTGWDGFEAQWECKSELPEGMSLGSTVVNCEGYSGPDDEYILRGSCGLEYELRWTTGRPANWQNPDLAPNHRQKEWDLQHEILKQQHQRQEQLRQDQLRQQQQKQQQHDAPHQHPEFFYGHDTSQSPAKHDTSWGIGSWLMLGLIGYLVYKILKSMASPPTETGGSTLYTRPVRIQHAAQPPPPRPTHNDAPYRNNDAYTHLHGDHSGDSWAKWQRNTDTVPEATRVYTTAEPAQQQPQGGRFGGFWSGAGLGGLAGYALGRVGRRQEPVQQPPQAAQQNQPYYTGPVATAPVGTSGEFYTKDQRYSVGSTGSSASYGGISDASPPPAQQTTQTHTSTGYGTTKRR